MQHQLYSDRISIHSLRVEGDYIRFMIGNFFRYFNPLPPSGGRRRNDIGMVFYIAISIHSLRVEGDGIAGTTINAQQQDFNPLPPSGGRRDAARCIRLQTYHFNPLPPSGGRRSRGDAFSQQPSISIHSLRVEGDKLAVIVITNDYRFQSTPSEWRETISGS